MSDILNAMSTVNETKKKVIVDHTGSCGIYHYAAGIEVDLPESVIKAIGSGVTVVGEATPQVAPVQEHEQVEETENQTQEVSEIKKETDATQGEEVTQ